MSGNEPSTPDSRVRRRRRRIALAVLAALTAAFWLACLLFVFPALELRATIQRFHEDGRTWYEAHFFAPPEKKEAWRDRRARKTIKELGGPARAARRLGAYLRLPRWFAAHRHHAADVLGGCGAAGVPELVRALDDGDARVRAWAIRSLGKIGPDAREALAPLERMLAAPAPLRPAARKAIEEALARIRGEET